MPVTTGFRCRIRADAFTIRKRPNHLRQKDRALVGDAPFMSTDHLESNSALCNLEIRFDGWIAVAGNPVIGKPKTSANLGRCERADKI
jgi:hypothetical protein